MSERAFDVWVYDQLHPNEKNYGGGKKQRPNHSFLKPLPEHLVGRGPKKKPVDRATHIQKNR